MLTLDSVADFTFSFHHKFFLETEHGNYEWSDPEYPGGDNTIKKVNMSYKEWCKSIGIPYGRSKGKHKIRSYCGEDVKIIEDN